MTEGQAAVIDAMLQYAIERWIIGDDARAAAWTACAFHLIDDDTFVNEYGVTLADEVGGTYERGRQ
jgi:hypothetical protein